MFAFHDEEWPGLSKLVEESGEILQVAGKLMGSRGVTDHWSGDLRAKLVEELADQQAANLVFTQLNMTTEEQDQIAARVEKKIRKFIKWHKNNNQ